MTRGRILGSVGAHRHGFRPYSDFEMMHSTLQASLSAALLASTAALAPGLALGSSAFTTHTPSGCTTENGTTSSWEMVPRSIAVSPLRDEFSNAKAKAQKAQLDGLLELAIWCHKNKSYAQRDQAYEAVLILDPEHKEARKFLKYTFDRKASKWIRKRPYKLPKEGAPEIVDEAFATRKALDDGFVNSMIDLVEKHVEKLGPDKKREELELLLAAAPDHPRIRKMLGYVAVEKQGKVVWTTQVAVDTEKAREDILALLEDAREAVPEAEEIELLPGEDALEVDWTLTIGSKRVRVIGNVEEDEGEAALAASHLAWDFLPKMIGGNLKPPKNFTLYLIEGEDQRQAFIDEYPGIPDDKRAYYPELFSAWMPNSPRCACWASEPVQRLDVACKQTTTWYLDREFKVSTNRGWLSEGIGLYINQLVVGTRLAFAITVTDYDDPNNIKTDRDMEDPEADWILIASEILAEAKPTVLAGTLGRNSSEMTPQDLVLSYALVAYLREGHGMETMRKILKRVGKGEGSSVQILEDVLGVPLPKIQIQLREWIDAVGGHSY